MIVECVKKGSYMRYLLMMCMGPELCSLSVPVKTVCEWIRPRRRSICEKALVVCLFWFSVCELMECVCDQAVIKGPISRCLLNGYKRLHVLSVVCVSMAIRGIVLSVV